MKTLKILITGANGLFGQKIVAKIANQGFYSQVLISKGEARFPIPSSAKYYNVDITDFPYIEKIIINEKPDVIVHPAALTNVDYCELHPDECFLVNYKSTEHILEVSKQIQAFFIFFSTDFVFGGEKKFYIEEDPPNPLSVYAMSKVKSEELVKQYPYKWAIVRTCLVYGVSLNPRKSNIVFFIKEKLTKGEQIRIVWDQYRTPTFSDDLAEGVLSLINKEKEGIFHISGQDFMPILEIAYIVASFWKLDKTLIKPVATYELNAPAKRPPMSGLDISKSKLELSYQPTPFLKSLEIIERQLS